jgi:membrane-associated protease RseP (regulator of RpoE activity)
MRKPYSKPTPTHRILLGLALGLPGLALANPTIQIDEIEGDGLASAIAQALSFADGDVTASMQRMSVTITSDGTNTIKKTVTYRDGKKTVTTEITDADGNVTRVIGDDEDAPLPEGLAAPDRLAFLGVSTSEPHPSLRLHLDIEDGVGVVVDAVVPDSPAAAAGITAGDILVAIDEVALNSPEGLADKIRARKPGDKVKVQLIRKGTQTTVILDLGQAPAGQAEAAPSAPPLKEIENKVRSMIELNIEPAFELGGIVTGELKQIIDDAEIPEAFRGALREMLEKMEGRD